MRRQHTLHNALEFSTVLLPRKMRYHAGTTGHAQALRTRRVLKQRHQCIS
jgi:hypothetical protein